MGVTSAGRGLGSTFYFELPVYGPDYTPPEPRPQPEKHQSTQPKPTHRAGRSRRGKANSVVCDDSKKETDGVPAINSAFSSSTSGDHLIAWQEEGSIATPSKISSHWDNVQEFDHSSIRPLRLLIVVR